MGESQGQRGHLSTGQVWLMAGASGMVAASFAVGITTVVPQLLVLGSARGPLKAS